MSLNPAAIAIEVWEAPGILLEHYAYTSGAIEPLPAHAHAEYQFGLSFDFQGEYAYRGSIHAIPTGSLSVIHSGEVHRPSQRDRLLAPATFWMMHLDPKLLQTAAAELADKPASEPFISKPSLTDPGLVRRFQQAFAALANKASPLERETALQDFLTYAIAHYAETPSAAARVRADGAGDRPAIAQVRDFLQAYYAQNISLADLATLSGLSRFHLSRVFRQETGLSLSAYQQQLRIAQAKRLLVRGMPIAKVATEVGFYDQSHLGKHFKRLVGVTPGNYISQRNIVLDSQEAAS